MKIHHIALRYSTLKLYSYFLRSIAHRPPQIHLISYRFLVTEVKMKKIAIFGASGMTGICAVDAALNQGLNISVSIISN